MYPDLVEEILVATIDRVLWQWPIMGNADPRCMEYAKKAAAAIMKELDARDLVVIPSDQIDGG